MAAALAELMARLGYERYGAQGGDFGAFVAPDLGRVDSEHVIGVHVNAATMGFIPFGELSDEDKASLTEVERARLGRMANFLSEGNGYFGIQSTRPQTLSFALTDSPAGQLAWIIEKFKEWTGSSHDLPGGAVGLDTILTESAFTGSPGQRGRRRTCTTSRCTGMIGRHPRRCPPVSRFLPRTLPYAVMPSRPTTSSNGVISTQAATLPRSRHPTCW